nr:hypothetical protein [Tanacetum cinerariifolium]
ELALMCGRMFPQESDKIEKYVDGLLDMIHGSVMASKPKTMQDVVEFATEIMDKKIHTFAERQTENKRKSMDTSRNNQNQQQQNKRSEIYLLRVPSPRTFQEGVFKAKNKNRSNQGGNGNAPAKVYVVGNAGTNPDSNIVTGWRLSLISVPVQSKTKLILLLTPFMELALMCGRMFPQESDKIEKYVDGLLDMIHGSVMASKPKTMQDVVEFATEIMDKKIHTFAERQTENKRKSMDTSRNNQNQQQQNKR